MFIAMVSYGNISIKIFMTYIIYIEIRYQFIRNRTVFDSELIVFNDAKY